ncbi:MAG: tRNA threonylcarbamoyladenosine dehydratase [Coriobacteriia bacterium]|nr:tRNA threonylcarbamoyladenosine dehydratase [Coriobacteriia bacterium]
MFSRTIDILGSKSFKKINNSTIVVCGLGGVGSYTATSLARSGVGSLILVDFDKIDKSNINRQEFAYISTIGKYKTDLAREIIKDINPECNVTCITEKITQPTFEADFVIDAIDDVPAKIKLAKAYNGKIISCMGTAQRINPEKLTYADIYETKVCPLCKAFRKEARKADIKSLPVVYSTETAIKGEGLGSTSFVPPVAGFMLASYAVRQLI